MSEAFESEDSGRESVTNCSEKLDAKFGDGGGNVMDDGLRTAGPGGVPTVDGVSEGRAGLNSTKLDGVGGVPSSAELAVRSSDLVTTTSAAAVGKPRDEANEATGRGSIDSVSRKEESKGWSEGDGDGDEEDNADGDEDGDAEADGAGAAGGSGGGGGGGQEGEEGSWWWSWTWGALPVRWACRRLPFVFVRRRDGGAQVSSRATTSDRVLRLRRLRASARFLRVVLVARGGASDLVVSRTDASNSVLGWSPVPWRSKLPDSTKLMRPDVGHLMPDSRHAPACTPAPFRSPIVPNLPHAQEEAKEHKAKTPKAEEKSREQRRFAGRL